MGARGPKPKAQCVNGHDLTTPGAVRVTPRTRNGKTYPERQCVACLRDRSREWWRKNRTKAATA